MDDTDADRDDYFYIRRYTAGRRHQVEVSYHKKCLFEKFLFDYAIEGKISWDEYRSIYDILFSDDDPITEKGIPSGPETEWPSLPDPSLFGG